VLDSISNVVHTLDVLPDVVMVGGARVPMGRGWLVVQVGYSGAGNFSGSSKLVRVATEQVLGEQTEKQAWAFVTLPHRGSRSVDSGRDLPNAAAYLLEAVESDQKGYAIRTVDDYKAIPTKLYDRLVLLSVFKQGRKRALTRYEDFRKYLAELFLRIFDLGASIEIVADQSVGQINFDRALTRPEDAQVFHSIGFVVVKWHPNEVREYLSTRLACKICYDLTPWPKLPIVNQAGVMPNEAERKVYNDRFQAFKIQAVHDLFRRSLRDTLQVYATNHGIRQGRERIKLPGQVKQVELYFENEVVNPVTGSIAEEGKSLLETGQNLIRGLVCNRLDTGDMAGAYHEAWKLYQFFVDLEVTATPSYTSDQTAVDGSDKDSGSAYTELQKVASSHRLRAGQDTTTRLDLYLQHRQTFYQRQVERTRTYQRVTLYQNLKDYCRQLAEAIGTDLWPNLSRLHNILDDEQVNLERKWVQPQEFLIDALIDFRAYDQEDLDFIFQRKSSDMWTALHEKGAAPSTWLGKTDAEVEKLVRAASKSFFDDLPSTFNQFVDEVKRPRLGATLTNWQTEIVEQAAPMIDLSRMQAYLQDVPHMTWSWGVGGDWWKIGGTEPIARPWPLVNELFVLTWKWGIPLSAMADWHDLINPAFLAHRRDLLIPEFWKDPKKTFIGLWAEAKALAGC
jgi:hypothetical protein